MKQFKREDGFTAVKCKKHFNQIGNEFLNKKRIKNPQKEVSLTNIKTTQKNNSINTIKKNLLLDRSEKVSKQKNYLDKSIKEPSDISKKLTKEVIGNYSKSENEEKSVKNEYNINIIRNQFNSIVNNKMKNNNNFPKEITIDDKNSSSITTNAIPNKPKINTRIVKSIDLQYKNNSKTNFSPHIDNIVNNEEEIKNFQSNIKKNAVKANETDNKKFKTKEKSNIILNNEVELIKILKSNEKIIDNDINKEVNSQSDILNNAEKKENFIINNVDFSNKKSSLITDNEENFFEESIEKMKSSHTNKVNKKLDFNENENLQYFHENAENKVININKLQIGTEHEIKNTIENEKLLDLKQNLDNEKSTMNKDHKNIIIESQIEKQKSVEKEIINTNLKEKLDLVNVLQHNDQLKVEKNNSFVVKDLKTTVKNNKQIGSQFKNNKKETVELEIKVNKIIDGGTEFFGKDPITQKYRLKQELATFLNINNTLTINELMDEFLKNLHNLRLIEEVNGKQYILFYKNPNLKKLMDCEFLEVDNLRSKFCNYIDKIENKRIVENKDKFQPLINEHFSIKINNKNDNIEKPNILENINLDNRSKPENKFDQDNIIGIKINSDTNIQKSIAEKQEASQELFENNFGLATKQIEKVEIETKKIHKLDVILKRKFLIKDESVRLYKFL